MFNLGYMHELGHGMRQDFHLAKRFYDQAAETSADAKVPVALALAKLGFIFFMNNWKDYESNFNPELVAIFKLYWDLYLLTLLCLLLGLLVFTRRNQRRPINNNNNNINNNNNNNQRQPMPPPQQRQPAERQPQQQSGQPPAQEPEQEQQPQQPG